MKKLKMIAMCLSSSFAVYMITIGLTSLQSACALHYYQPELPEELNELRK